MVLQHFKLKTWYNLQTTLSYMPCILITILSEFQHFHSTFQRLSVQIFSLSPDTFPVFGKYPKGKTGSMLETSQASAVHPLPSTPQGPFPGIPGFDLNSVIRPCPELVYTPEISWQRAAHFSKSISSLSS